MSNIITINPRNAQSPTTRNYSIPPSLKCAGKVALFTVKKFIELSLTFTLFAAVGGAAYAGSQLGALGGAGAFTGACFVASLVSLRLGTQLDSTILKVAAAGFALLCASGLIATATIAGSDSSGTLGCFAFFGSTLALVALNDAKDQHGNNFF